MDMGSCKRLPLVCCKEAGSATGAVDTAKPYHFLREENGVAGILTTKFPQVFVEALGIQSFNGKTDSLRVFSSLYLKTHQYSVSKDETNMGRMETGLICTCEKWNGMYMVEWTRE